MELLNWSENRQMPILYKDNTVTFIFYTNLNEIKATAGKERMLKNNYSRLLSVCILYLNNKCKYGASCNQAHFIDCKNLKQNVDLIKQNPPKQCCQFHDNIYIPKEYIGQYIQIENGNYISFEYFSFTYSLLFLIGIQVPIHSFCHAYINGTCSYGFLCKRLHPCKQLPLALFCDFSQHKIHFEHTDLNDDDDETEIENIKKMLKILQIEG